MTTKDKLKIARGVCGFAVGWAIGSVVNAVTRPRGAVDSVLTTIGASAIAYTVGSAFDREFNELCEKVFDVNMSEKTHE